MKRWLPSLMVMVSLLMGWPLLARSRSLSSRQATRPYEGAPPVIPHPVRAMRWEQCQSCHDGGQEGRAIGPPVPHRVRGDCRQCHVEQVTEETWKRNTFQGWRPQREQRRAYPGAPPLIPHPVAMREKCLACHGPQGYEEIRTSHPERLACQQCHVEAANRSTAKERTSR